MVSAGQTAARRLKLALRNVFVQSEPRDVPGRVVPTIIETASSSWPPKTNSVGVATVAPFHNSIGDFSTAEVTQRWLSFSGIAADQTSFWDSKLRPQMVIGGGDIIGVPTGGAWRDIKPMFIPRGNHALNAVGVDPESYSRLDVEAMRDYCYISVRDIESADYLRSKGLPAVAVPCPATLQPALPLETIQRLPRFGCLISLRHAGYAIVHRHPSLVPIARFLKRQGQLVLVVDMQGHSQHSWPKNLGVQVPPTHSSVIVKGLVDASAVVYTSSLHLAIFALSSAIPFAVVDTENYQSEKVRRYLRRAGLVEAMSSPAGLIETVDLVSKEIARVSELERHRAVVHLDALVSRLGQSRGHTGPGALHWK